MTFKNVIDVSACQGIIDWNRINVDAVIIRAGYGKEISQKDQYFERNYQGAKQRGIPKGVYWYSYATDEDGARAEADACLQIIKGKKFEFPIYYDVEEDKQFMLGREKVSAIIRAFLERVEAAGYWVGLYGNLSSLTQFTDDDIKKRYSIWLAHWGVTKSPYKGDYGLWQTGVGTIYGINGKVDLDIGYVDYPTLIKEKGLNGYGSDEKEECPYPEPQRLLKNPTQGDDVKWLQWNLINLGYDCGNGGIDGYFGDATEKALKEFQQKNNLLVDGICGPQTIEKIKMG